MNDPFFRSYSNPRTSRLARPVQVHQPYRKPSPKVVSVPVHFVSSSGQSSSEKKKSAVLKIQSMFRGGLVRKYVKKIASIEKELREIEWRISDVGMVELIRKDKKERLRVNETLMSLLLKLDSIRGVDSGVRDLRKAVIKKAIALQEKVDSIVTADYQNLEITNNETGSGDSENISLDHNSSLEQFRESNLEQVPEASSCLDDSGKLEDEDLVPMADAEEGTGIVAEVVKEIDENCDTVVKDVGECMEESVETSPAEGFIEGGKDDKLQKKVEASVEVHENDGRDENKRNRELLEKLMEDNEKMMILVTQIFERNEMQTRMLNSLSQRVEQLEKAFMSDKLRRKKKRHSAS